VQLFEIIEILTPDVGVYHGAAGLTRLPNPSLCLTFLSDLLIFEFRFIGAALHGAPVYLPLSLPP
jgi:hypothetical protein